jgi:hypothetical protein
MLQFQLGELFTLSMVNKIGQTGSLLGKEKRNQSERRELIEEELDKVGTSLKYFLENSLEAFHSRLWCKIVSFKFRVCPAARDYGQGLRA